ncbi:uncharacterized protein LOC127641614 [Xyrauchen texanus]|uniref:uncharacterized protein LOC127641614 n=1 Tax=Xyrauchen texanus TaxID=154827 RepID=UPI0022422D1B|nr:uncharacterized protein LOC127641614 [Xyrauchen texanus]XP_051980551.1 uncharacterized protein LOC127641614 [Xyrauchen texanus]
MKEHHIQLNSAKTELLVFPANPAVEHNITVQLGPTTVSPSKTVRNLGPNDTTVTARIAACLADISAWMKEHHIQLNSAKTELLVFPANPAVEHNITVQLGPTTVSPSKTVRNLGPNDTTVTARIAACLADISAWMKEHHIQLNSAKTELLVFPANPAVEHNITVQLGPTTVSPSKTVRNLGVTIDDELNFTDHISKTARSCRFTLDNIRKIRSFLSVHATQLLVQSPCHN